MATIASVVEKGRLHSYDLPEWDKRQPIRLLYVATELFDWADYTPALLNTMKNGRSLHEHMETMFAEFRCAVHFSFADIKRMLPTKEGVWRMYPPGLRIYGWCPEPHQFVAVAGALETDTKSDKTLNDRKRDEVLAFISRNQLQSCILRGDHNAVFPA